MVMTKLNVYQPFYVTIFKTSVHVYAVCEPRSAKLFMTCDRDKLPEASAEYNPTNNNKGQRKEMCHHECINTITANV